jgi:large subunit ribosomal protein L4
MFKAPYYKADGKKGRARALPESVFDGVINDSVMHQAVKVYLANQRQGTHSAKTRGEVKGGNSKPWRQKGTGRARAGSTRSPLWPGGGIVFPPKPHSWRQQIPKKVRALARRSALNDRAQNERVVIADMPKADKPKTKDLLGFLKAVGAEGKVLLLTDGKNERMYLSGRNAPSISVLPYGEETVYDVLWAETVVIERSALERDGAGAEEETSDE